MSDVLGKLNPNNPQLLHHTRPSGSTNLISKPHEEENGMTLNKVLKPTNTSSLQKHSVRSLSDMMGDFDSSDDENVENLPPLPNDQVS